MLPDEDSDEEESSNRLIIEDVTETKQETEGMVVQDLSETSNEEKPSVSDGGPRRLIIEDITESHPTKEGDVDIESKSEKTETSSIKTGQPFKENESQTLIIQHAAGEEPSKEMIEELLMDCQASDKSRPLIQRIYEENVKEAETGSKEKKEIKSKVLLDQMDTLSEVKTPEPGEKRESLEEKALKEEEQCDVQQIQKLVSEPEVQEKDPYDSDLEGLD